MRYLFYFSLIMFFVSCSKSNDYGMECESKITGGTRLIWFDWGDNDNKFVFIDTLLIVDDISVNSVVYKNEYETGYQYLFKLKDLDLSFKDGQEFDDLSVRFIEYNDKDSLVDIYSHDFVIGYERASLEKKSDHEYLFRIVGQNIDSMKMLSGRFPNAGIVFVDTEILFRIIE